MSPTYCHFSDHRHALKMRLQDKEQSKHCMKCNIYKRVQGKIDFIRKKLALISANELYMKGMDSREMMETTMLEECNSVSHFLPHTLLI